MRMRLRVLHRPKTRDYVIQRFAGTVDGRPSWERYHRARRTYYTREAAQADVVLFIEQRRLATLLICT